MENNLFLVAFILGITLFIIAILTFSTYKFNKIQKNVKPNVLTRFFIDNEEYELTDMIEYHKNKENKVVYRIG